MPTSIIYDSALYDIETGAMDMDTDTFKCMLVNSTYAAIADATKKRTHTKRSDVTANEVTGTGYTAGGASCTVTVVNDTTNDRCDTTLGAPTSWTTSTITASGAVYYKSRGGAASADNLVAYVDFGGSLASTAGTFSLTASIKRIQN